MSEDFAGVILVAFVLVSALHGTESVLNIFVT